MQIKYPSWLPKFIGSNQTPQEMNQVIDVIQNHAENLSRHYRLILTNVGGIYPDIILPNSPFPEGITQAVFLVGPGTYVNFGNVVVPNNNVGLIFYYDETFDLSLVPLETYDDTPLRNRVTALEDKNGGEIAEGNNKNVTGGQVHSAMQSMETGGAKNLLELEDVDATQIPDGNFLVGKAGQKTEFRKLHAKDVRIGAGYQSGEYVVTWNYRTNNWGSGTLVTTSSVEYSIAKRDARGRLIAEAGTGEKHLVNYGQLPFKLFETENEAQSYLLGGLAKYGQLIFLQSGPQKGRMLQVNETLDGYNTLFDYELNLSSLLDLNDFPNAYTDAAGKVLIVNPTSSGIQFKSINEIDGIATYDSNGNLTATEATTNENVPTLGQVVRLLEDITVGAVPEATNENFGIVKYDNASIKKNSSGQLYAVIPELDDASYAKKDASGLTTANKNAWKTALGISDGSNVQEMMIPLSALNTNLVSGVDLNGFPTLKKFKIIEFKIGVTVPPTGSILSVGIKNNGTIVTSTNATIATNQYTSRTTTQPVFSNDTFDLDDRLNFFIPTGGVGSVNTGQNLIAYLKIEYL